jgi:hypothetical protein
MFSASGRVKKELAKVKPFHKVLGVAYRPVEVI